MPLGNVRWLGGLRGDSANSDGASEDAFDLRRARFRARRAARSRRRPALVRAVRPVLPGRRRPRRLLRRADVVRRMARDARARRRPAARHHRVSRRRHVRHPGEAVRAAAHLLRCRGQVRPPTRPARCASSSCRASATAGRSSRSSPTTRGSPTARASTRTRWSPKSIAPPPLGIELFVMDAGWYLRRRRNRRLRFRRRPRLVDRGSRPLSVRPGQPCRLRARRSA